MAAKIAGASAIVAVDVNDARLTLAQELGATHAVNGRNDDVRARLRTVAPDGLDYVVEVTGRPNMLVLALDSIGPMGTAALVGGPPMGTTAGIDMNTLLHGGLRLRGIVQGDSMPQIFIPELVALYQAGKFPFDRLIKRYELADINQAFADAARGDAIKPVVTMPAS